MIKNQIIHGGFGKTLTFDIPDADDKSEVFIHVDAVETTKHLLSLPTKKTIKIILVKDTKTTNETILTAESLRFGDNFLDYKTTYHHFYKFHSRA